MTTHFKLDELSKRLSAATDRIIDDLVATNTEEEFWQAMTRNHGPIQILLTYWKAFRGEWFEPGLDGGWEGGK